MSTYQEAYQNVYHRARAAGLSDTEAHAEAHLHAPAHVQQAVPQIAPAQPEPPRELPSAWSSLQEQVFDRQMQRGPADQAAEARDQAELRPLVEQRDALSVRINAIVDRIARRRFQG